MWNINKCTVIPGLPTCAGCCCSTASLTVCQSSAISNSNPNLRWTWYEVCCHCHTAKVLPCPVCPVIVVVAVLGCLLMKFLFGINMSTFPSRFIYFFLRSFLCRWKTFIHMRKLLMLLNDVTDKCYGLREGGAVRGVCYGIEWSWHVLHLNHEWSLTERRMPVDEDAPSPVA